MARTHDFDWIVIGSGFGGSVSALRLAEKGYRVAVLECGQRYRDEDFAKSAWNLRRYFWMPKLGLRGVFRMTIFKDVFIVSGIGVGGGSLGYANTLYRARPAFFTDPQWGELADWERELAAPLRHRRADARRDVDYEGDGTGRRAAEGIRRGDRRRRHLQARPGSALFSASPARRSRTLTSEARGRGGRGCIRCGSCMVGCRHGAKNTLVKNYLWFAEKLGVTVIPERQVTDMRPARRCRRQRRLRGYQRALGALARRKAAGR